MQGDGVVDRRVARTRRALRDALVGLIHDRGWDDISVKDVCDAANVGRSTFYAHFGDKEELLTSGFDGLMRELRAHRGPDEPGGAPQRGGGGAVLRFVRPLIAHAASHRWLYRALVGKHSGRVIERRFRLVVLTLVAEELGVDDADPSARFVAGGVLELLTGELERPSVAPDVLDAQIQALAGRLLPARAT